MSTRLHVALWSFIALSMLAGVILAPRDVHRAPTSGDISERDAYWTSLIRREGAAQAYGDFGAAVASLPPQLQHENAHVFGGALFEVEGLPGLATCDSKYSFGCYHEFLGRAIASLGLSVVTKLNQDCVDLLKGSALSCQHGIGHGIEAALGYDGAALKKSLALCESLPYNDPIGGCYGGVFMEYNMQTMLGDQGKPRALVNGDVQYPCDTVGEPFTPACYFWQPQWWHQILREQGIRDQSAIYAKIGAYCMAAPAADRRSCFEGTGNNLVADANFDGDAARELCIAATKDPTYQLYCRSLAADSLFVGGAGKKGDAEAVCEGLTGASYEYCAAYASNHANIANELPSVQ